MTDLFNDIYACKDEQAKNNAIVSIENILNKRLNDDEKTALRSTIRKAIVGNHFDVYSAKQRISQMYYTTTDGCIIHAPFVSERECAELYEEYKSQIKGYNLYDFSVVLNNVIADNYKLLYSWWPNEEWCIMLIKFCEIAVNWLNDDDTPFMGEKAWKLLGSK
ncbi:DUF7841 family protein [Prevotella sp.]|uniref:DUF7841 family protein n=1 Tax=Prevotella sp. TaxID=59823 RepID=UPI00307CBD79